MCDTADDGVGISNSVADGERLKRAGLRSAGNSAVMPFARALADARENRAGDPAEVEVTRGPEPWDKNPRRWEGMPYIEDFALRGGYDLLIHGKGGPIPKTDFRYEQIPWLRPEHFLQRSTTYPLDLHLLINKKTWDPIWEYGRGGRARLTDAEGTDISWTHWDEDSDGTRYGFSATPRTGHLFGHPGPPPI